MKKYLLVFLLAFLCFFSIDKIYAYNYSSWSPETVYIDGTSQKDSWVTSNYTLIGVRTSPNTSLGHHLVYDYNLIHNDYDTFYNVTFVAYSDEAWDYTRSNFNGSMSVAWRGAGINYGGSCNVNSVGTDKFFTITCNDVKLEGSKHLYLDIYTNNIYNVNTNNLFGIVNYIWTSKTSQQSLIDALNNLNNNQVITNQELQDQNKNLEEANKQAKETNDYIKDDTAPDVDISGLGNVQGLLPPGPVDSLLNIPFMFLSVVTSSFGGVCVPIEGNFVFDSKLTIPCFSEVIYNKVPSALMTFLSLIPATFILIKYFKHLYKKVDRAVSMDSNSDDEWGVL